MLSAETAVGQYPIEAVTMMDRIVRRVQEDPLYFTTLQSGRGEPEHTASDAISAAACQVAATVGAAAIVSFTSSGATALRAARERPAVPILAMTPNLGTARRLALLWGAHCVHSADIRGFADMVQKAVRAAHREEIAQPGPARGDHRRRPVRHARRDQHPAHRLGGAVGHPGLSHALDVLPGLVPGVYVFLPGRCLLMKTWVPATSPGRALGGKGDVSRRHRPRVRVPAAFASPR